MIDGGKTPVLPPDELQAMGFAFAVYPLALLSAAVKAMNAALARLKAGKPTDDLLESFETVKDVVGFNDYYAEDDRYKTA